MSDPRSSSRLPRLALIVLPLLAAVAAGLWWGWPATGVAVAQECRASQATAERIRPKAEGEVAAVAVSKAPSLLPEIAFVGPSGEPMTLAAFKGSVALVNLWATWCVPCREEMPALDRLQEEFWDLPFAVVAINVDTRDPDKPKAWLQANGIRSLVYYADASGKLLQALQRSGHMVGLPTTLLIDSNGCEIAILKGPAAWDSIDAKRLVRAALGKG